MPEPAWFVAPFKGYTLDTPNGPIRANGKFIRLTDATKIAAARSTPNLWEINDPADFGKWDDLVLAGDPARITNLPDLGIGDRIPLLICRGASGKGFAKRFPRERFFHIGINAGTPVDATKYYPSSDVFMVEHDDVEASCSMDGMYSLKIASEWLREYKGFLITPKECAYRCYTSAHVIAYQWPWTDIACPARTNQSLVFAAGFLATAGFKRAVITGCDLKTSVGEKDNPSETNRRTKTTRGLRWLEETYGIRFFRDDRCAFKDFAPVWTD